MREELESMIEGITDEIKQAMGTAETVTAGPYRIDWKQVSSSRIDTKGLKASFPAIASAFTVPVITKRFTITG